MLRMIENYVTPVKRDPAVVTLLEFHVVSTDGYKLHMDRDSG
jgi:hypothetical protein